jgi:hypothetical protein
VADLLVDRLRGKYKIGENGEFGTRDFSSAMPPICEEAAARIEALEVELFNHYYHEACGRGAGHMQARKYAKDRLKQN